MDESIATPPIDTATRRYKAAAWSFALAVTVLCWLITLRSVREMGGGMPMPGGWTMSMGWMVMPGQSIGAAAAMFLSMWLAMMVAMMLPSVLPVVLLYHRLAKGRRARQVPVTSESVLLAGYFSIWLAFGAVAFAVGLWFSGLTMGSEALSRAVPALSAAALMLAGAYQVTPLKRVCLRHCRSPLSFFTTAWRDGWAGTFRLGVHHGAYCVACCWALMLIQIVVGVMNLWMMAAIAAVIAIEKSWRHGERFATVAGAAAVAAGGLQLLRLLSQGG